MTTRKQTITVTCEVCGAKFETDPNDPAHKIDHSRGDAIPADGGGERERKDTGLSSYDDKCPNGHWTKVKLTLKHSQ